MKLIPFGSITPNELGLLTRPSLLKEVREVIVDGDAGIVCVLEQGETQADYYATIVQEATEVGVLGLDEIPYLEW